MNKSELINAVAQKAEISKAAANRVVDAVILSISRALEKGENVSLIGFGTFTVRERAARMGRNPQTGQIINIKAAMAPVFRAGKALKDAVQKLKDRKK